LIASAGQTYIGVLVAEDVLDVMKIDQALTMKNLEAASYREEVGSTSQQEVLRWKTKLYKSDQNIAGQQASVRVNRIALNQLRNQPEEKAEVLERLTLEEDGFVFTSSLVDQILEDESKAKILRDYLVEIGLGNSPLLGSMDAQIAAQQRQLKLDKRWLIPDFDLMVGGDDQFAVIDAGDGGTETGAYFWFADAKMSWTVFRGGSNISKVKQQKIVSQELQFQRTEVKTSQEKAIRSQASLLIADFKNVRLANEQAEVADKNYEMVYDAYLLGEVTLLALLDAQEQKFIADYSTVVAYYTFLLDLLSLEEMIGYFPFLEPQEEVDLVIAELERRITGE
jgi:outer membrane protein TolC